MDVRWTDEYAIGQPDIDRDHRTLVGILGVLSQGYCDRDLVDTQIKMLEHYVADHFSREEQMMFDGGYPDLEPHQEQHWRFCNEVKRMRESWATGDTLELQAEIIDRLSAWLMDHILVVDRRYMPWIKR